MQNFINALSILAFIMTSISYILAIYNKSIRLSVSVKDYAKKFLDIVQLYLMFQNNSSKPITVSGISIIDNGAEHHCELVPKLIMTIRDDVVRSTPQFPINLGPYQGLLLPFEFLNCPNIELAPDKKVELRIYTNLKPLTKSVVLGKQLYYLRTKKK